MSDDRCYEVVIEVPRGSFIKRTPSGGIDFIAPFPSPFNYGSVPNTLSPDGDPLDAVLLGPRLGYGERASATQIAEVDFIDAGEPDPKIILGQRPMSRRDRLRVLGFFRFYAVAKSLLNRARGKSGSTQFRGFRDV